MRADASRTLVIESSPKKLLVLVGLGALMTAGAAVAMDNCPHQVVLAVPPAEVEPVLARLREENILWEDLPFERAYHTEAFRSVLGPIVEFFADLTFRAPRLPIYSCASRGRMPEGLDSIRELAVAQWTRPVAFRETIDGLRKQRRRRERGRPEEREQLPLLPGDPEEQGKGKR